MNISEKIKRVKDIGCPEELLKLLGKDYFDKIDISHRGGAIGFCGKTISDFTDINEDLLPNNFGAYCNYLGGGLRGTINKSDFSDEVKGKKRELLNELGEALIRCYNYYEQDAGLQEETDQEGETNWENSGTNKSRNAGIVSAY